MPGTEGIPMAEDKVKVKKAKKQREKEEEKGGLSIWEPFAELRNWRPFGLASPSRLDRWLRELDEDWSWPSDRRGWLPALDVTEGDGEYVVTMELAGTSKDDVTVEFGDGVLTIRGEKKSEREEEDEQRRFVERCYGTFSRSFTLPRDAEGEKIDAKLENGVLTLSIPKSEAAKPRTVAIK
jgi:HSP20 family protein